MTLVVDAYLLHYIKRLYLHKNTNTNHINDFDISIGEDDGIRRGCYWQHERKR